MLKAFTIPIALLVTLLAGTAAMSSSATVDAPAPRIDERAAGPRAVAVFAGGCFWGVEGVYEHVRGVIDAKSGYTGGSAMTARYPIVSSGRTAHAEAVRVVYDPTKISYGQLLRIYFSVVADPTLKDRQGPDHGPQYRSAIFPTNPAQAKVARAYIAQMTAARTFPRPIVTTIEPYKGFHLAEAEHQDFMARNPRYPYIVINDRPKVEALRKNFPGVWRG